MFLQLSLLARRLNIPAGELRREQPTAFAPKTCRVYLGWRGDAADADLGTGLGSHQALGRSTNPLCAERGMMFDVTKGFSWEPQLGGMA